MAVYDTLNGPEQLEKKNITIIQQGFWLNMTESKIPIADSQDDL